MRNFSLLLITLCAVSLKVHAVDEIIITAAPYTPPSYTQHTVSLGAANTGDRDAQIFKARVQACTSYAAKQKDACDVKKEQIFLDHIDACEKMGTNGTRAMVGGTAVGAVGTLVALFSGPPGWAVWFLIGGGVVVGGGGALAQQEGNYGCRDDANNNKATNTLACNNYKAKIEAEICSKITPNNIQ